MFRLKCLTIKQAKIKYKSLFVNKPMNMRNSLSVYNVILYTYTCIQIYLYRLEIGLYKFVNKFVRYKIIICNFLIILTV